jgi:hypothetical protein
MFVFMQTHCQKKLSCTVQLMMQSFSIYRSAMHVVLPYTHTVSLQRGTTANIVPLPIRYHQTHKMAVKTELPHSTADDTDLPCTNISYTCGAATHPHSTIVQICHCREVHCQYSSAAMQYHQTHNMATQMELLCTLQMC